MNPVRNVQAVEYLILLSTYNLTMSIKLINRNF